MMLRESSKATGSEVDLEAIKSGESRGSDIAGEAQLLDFAAAVVNRDKHSIASTRKAIVGALGAAAAADAGATVAAFHGYTIVADATGCDVPEQHAVSRRELHEVLEIKDWAPN